MDNNVEYDTNVRVRITSSNISFNSPTEKYNI